MPENNDRRLIEAAFPLKQASLDSVHEKNVRHGHISTLHIWPARRPLAACRGALIAALLPDPGTPEKRKELCEKIGGRVKEEIERKKTPGGRMIERVKETTEGGILHWKRETENAETLEWFKQEIRKAYGGRAPKVLDPFAGGGSIPLEAMRLGCEATAVDINPVAWFILKCTLEYPQKLAGKSHPLPDFIFENQDFMKAFFKAGGLTDAEIRKQLEALGQQTKGSYQEDLPLKGMENRGPDLNADLAWHVRAWGNWVLDQARIDLAAFYPTYADFEPVEKHQSAYEPEEMRLVPLNAAGVADIDALNADFSKSYLAQKNKPRWIAKPTVAYLWARTVICKNCRAVVPLLKTRWLCKKSKKRVLLTMAPNSDRTGVTFGIENDVPVRGGNAAQQRQHDKNIGAGTMTRAGAACPCCETIMTMQDIRLEGQAGRLGALPTAVVVNGLKGKEYRLPTRLEIQKATDAEKCIDEVFADIPFGLPDEPTPIGGGTGAARAFSIHAYGLTKWKNMFSSRQLFTLAIFIKKIKRINTEKKFKTLEHDLQKSIESYLALTFNRLISFNCVNVRWKIDAEAVIDAFARFAIPVLWDFAEATPINSYAGSYKLCFERIALALENLISTPIKLSSPSIFHQSAISFTETESYDLIFTDPPYYDAIPYSDLMDFFYIWLRRLKYNAEKSSSPFKKCTTIKWDSEKKDGELIDDNSRHDGDSSKSKAVYEDGMYRSFKSFNSLLTQNGRLVIVFAHKKHDAWETLVGALIRAGFVVTGSWPIQTEMGNRTRALTSAALASSVWMVCKKRPKAARPGWDANVLEEMKSNITEKLHDFWDAGIRGPDFVWAATGPALEAYSKHPLVKKADEPGQIMNVSEFLGHVRRIVVDFVVGRVLSRNESDDADASDLDSPTAYYLLHRNDFGLMEAPAGACILYAISCGLSDNELSDTWNILARAGGGGAKTENNTDDPDSAAEENEGSGSKVKLKTWAQRNHKNMGYEGSGGRPVPLIDHIHRLLHLWKAGDVTKVDDYIDDKGLRRNELFKRVLQSMIELSPAGTDERSLLENVSNHVGARGAVKERGQMGLDIFNQQN